MEFSRCPFCQQIVLSSELERHADDHFDDEDCSRDFEIAEQIAFALPSPARIAEDSFDFVHSLLEDPQTSSSGHNAYVKFQKRNFDEKYTALALSQKKETHCNVEGSLMTLLKNCLELDSENSVSILSGHVDHFQSSKGEDLGWGCGWRNIQMLSSHLLHQRQEANKILFGGSGFVPNIASLQRWLEFAWEKGFDAAGSDDFDHKIFGKSSWIGTTECATLFRSFGLRARIVDFCSKDSVIPVLCTGKNINQRKVSKAYGPMDIFLSQGKIELSLEVSSTNGSRGHSSISSEKVTNNHVLIDWVWNYFSGSNVDKSGNHRVICSEKAPLYFQHDGHSRTIVGIQAKRQKSGMQQYNLLIFDPFERTRVLEKSLRANHRWQKLIKRGAHTLKELQYQLCFIDPGIAHGEELEKLKSLHSTRHNF